MKNDISFIERNYEIGDEVNGLYPKLDLLGHLKPEYRFAPSETVLMKLIVKGTSVKTAVGLLLE